MRNPNKTAHPARNALCPCGSGRKYKHCCGANRPLGSGNLAFANRPGATPLPAIDQLLAAGMEAYRSNQSSEAEAKFSQVVERQPRHFTALLMLGAVAGRTGRIPLGIEWLRRAIVAQPQSADARLLLANFLRETGEFAGAVSLLQEALRLRPRDSALHSDLGLAYLCGHRVAEAIGCFERAVALDATFAIAHFNLACALERQRRTADAVAAYRRAIALAPDLVEAHSRLGNLLHTEGHRDEALACFRGATAASPDSTLGRLNRVKVLLEEDSAEAETVLRNIISLDPRSSEANRLLGNRLRETGRFEDAVACLDRAIDLDPTQIPAYHDLVHCKKLGDPDRPLITRMLSRLRGNHLGDRERALLHFAIGKSLDDLGAYDEAIGHLDEANRLERLGLFFDREQFAAHIDRLIEIFTADLIARNSAIATAAETPLFIVGMPRSGTTLVEQIVSSHPKIRPGGELSFWTERGPAFRTGANGLGPARMRRLATDYCALLQRIAPGAERVTDKMPFNFFWIGLIRAVLPNAFIIHCRRNPVDTCLSIYFTRFATRQDFAYDRSDIVFYYEQYARLMRHWRKTLPPRRFLEIDYEDLVANRDRLTRQLIAFIGLEWDDSCLQPESNRRIVKTASMWQARQPVYRTSLERWRRYEPWLGEFLQLLPRRS
jgi:tetratricopeptide (TPR) repeat protein